MTIYLSKNIAINEVKNNVRSTIYIASSFIVNAAF